MGRTRALWARLWPVAQVQASAGALVGNQVYALGQALQRLISEEGRAGELERAVSMTAAAWAMAELRRPERPTVAGACPHCGGLGPLWRIEDAAGRLDVSSNVAWELRGINRLSPVLRICSSGFREAPSCGDPACAGRPHTHEAQERRTDPAEAWLLTPDLAAPEGPAPLVAARLWHPAEPGTSLFSRAQCPSCGHTSLVSGFVIPGRRL